LDTLPKKLSKDDNSVVQFFEKVVLPLPVPSDLTDEEGALPPPTLPVLLSQFKPLSRPQSLEEAHLRLLGSGLPFLIASYRDVPGAISLLQIGIGALQKGFVDSNAAPEKLYQKS
jgi:hypothetical protein